MMPASTPRASPPSSPPPAPQMPQPPTLSPPPATPPMSTPMTARFIVKPRDIPVLELHQLQGMDASTRLQMFCELVEQCDLTDVGRIQIAKGRVCTELAILIHNNQTRHNLTNWAALKAFLQAEFAVEVSIDRAWQEMESMSYDWAEAPQAFTHRFICQFAVLETKFPSEKFPNRDKTIKRKLWYGLPRESREKLEGLLDENHPLQKFIDRLENEGQLLEERHTPQVRMVPAGGRPKDKPTAEKVEKTAQSPWKEEVERLSRQIAELRATLAKTQSVRPRIPPPLPRNNTRQPNTQSNKYCGYCVSRTHTLTECWRRPPPGHCFDCRRYGCYRGNKDCPGRDHTASARTPTDKKK